MELRFKCDDKTVTIEVSPENTIKEIREVLSDVIDIKEFSLFLDDQQLEDSTKIQKTEITSESIIQIHEEISREQELFREAMRLGIVDQIGGSIQDTAYSSILDRDDLDKEDYDLLFELLSFSDSSKLDNLWFDAVRNKNFELIHELIERNIYTDAKEYHNFLGKDSSVLIHAIETSDNCIVEKILRSERDFEYDEALCLAVYYELDYSVIDRIIRRTDYFGLFSVHNNYNWRTIPGEEHSSRIERSALLYSVFDIRLDLFDDLLYHMITIKLDHLKLVLMAIDDADSDYRDNFKRILRDKINENEIKLI